MSFGGAVCVIGSILRRWTIAMAAIPCLGCAMAILIVGRCGQWTVDGGRWRKVDGNGGRKEDTRFARLE